jgi:predicted nucleic acid-binding protein
VILADTSALYAVTDAADPNHEAAKARLAEIERLGETLLVHTYVLVETFALLQRRHGLAAALKAHDAVAQVKTVAVDRALHDRAAAWLRSHPSRKVSLVDAVSFEVMRAHGIATAFAFDDDFERAGFGLLGRP